MKNAARLFSRRDFVQTSVKGVIGVAVMPTILTSCSNWKGANDRVAVTDPYKGRRENAANIINTNKLFIMELRSTYTV